MTDGQTQLSLILTDIMLEIFHLRGKLIDKGDELVSPLGITSAEWQILGAIALASYPMTAPMIADVMGLTRQGAQKRLNRMVQDGYFFQKANPRHERSAFYVLTERGSTAFSSAMTLHARWANALTKDFAKNDLNIALTLLRSLRQKLNTINISEVQL